MKKALFLIMAAIFLVSCGKAQDKNMDVQSKDELKSDLEKFSYSVGFMVGSNYKTNNMEVDLDLILAGMRAAQDGKESVLSESEMQTILTSYQQMAINKMISEHDAASKEFLDGNAKKEGVVTTESGLQYKVIKEGTGKSPKATDKVKVHYKGTLITGEEFDSSYKRGEPISFPLNGVIKGWTEGLQLMKEGATYEFYIPSDLAYGKNPRPGGLIKPNDALIFQVELLEVNPKDAK